MWLFENILMSNFSSLICVLGVGERLHTAVEHVLKMLSMSTKQVSEVINTAVRETVLEIIIKYVRDDKRLV